MLRVHAQEQPLQLYEQKIKAGLVYNLLKYTTWPKSEKEKKVLQICLFGDDPFDGYLSPLQGHTAQQAQIFIVHVKQIKETNDCHVVIVHRNEEASLAELLAYISNKDILSISDINGFALRGGMIELTKEDEKISLYANKNVIDRSRLRVDDRIIRLAKIVSVEAAK